VAVKRPGRERRVLETEHLATVRVCLTVGSSHFHEPTVNLNCELTVATSSCIWLEGIVLLTEVSMALGKRCIVLFCAALPLLLLSGCVDYANEIHKALKRTYGRDFPDYTFRWTPTGTFGVGTMYLKDVKDPEKPAKEGMLIGLSQNWFVQNVAGQEKEALLTKIIVAGPLGSTSLKEDISRKTALNAFVPNLRGILSLGADVNMEKGVQVTLKAAEAVNHRINWTEFLIAMRDGKIKPEIKEHFQKHDCLIVEGDIVLSGYEATVTVNEKLNPELNAKLTGAVGKVLDKDSQVKGSFSSSTGRIFEVKAVNPVVVAILLKEPPGMPEAAADVDQWPTVKIPPPRLKEVEAAVSLGMDVTLTVTVVKGEKK
jgi:hypothetical protein